MALEESNMRRKEWRKFCKKRRRKLKRQKTAQERDRLEAEIQKTREADPQYQKFLIEQEQQVKVAAGREELERALRNAQWLEEEREAQQRLHKVRQQNEAKEREEREKRERIRTEFEARERKLEQARAERLRQQEELQRMVRERHTKLQEFAATGIDDYLIELQVMHTTRPEAEDCKFFLKTGACRHRFRCSGNHPTPGLSKIIVIPNFFNHPALEHTVHVEYGNDGRLEFDEEDLRNSFADFFRDIVDEFEQFGKVRQILVCRNFGSHLRGNVYIEYECIRSAAAAYLRMHGRFYAKKQLQVEFRSPIVWPAAVCGLFEMKRCQKGPACNFLHIFKNPDNRYTYDHFQESRSMRKQASVVPATPLLQKTWDEITSGSAASARNAVCWRWSESPEPEERAPSINSSTTPKERRHAPKTERKDLRKRTRSRSRNRKRSRSRDSSKSRSRSRSSSYRESRSHSRRHSRRETDRRSVDKRSDRERRKQRSRSPSSARTRRSRPSRKGRENSHGESRDRGGNTLSKAKS